MSRSVCPRSLRCPLTSEEYTTIRRVASREGVPMSLLVRMAVQSQLAENQLISLAKTAHLAQQGGVPYRLRLQWSARILEVLSHGPRTHADLFRQLRPAEVPANETWPRRSDRTTISRALRQLLQHRQIRHRSVNHLTMYERVER